MNLRFFLTVALVTPLLTLSGCSTIDVRAQIDPAGGAITDSAGCAYDFDRDGLWYVVFIHEDGLLGAVHRHNPGIHLFVDHGDLIFYVRCSGRDEVIDVMGHTFRLADGRVFLCDVDGATARTRQVRVKMPDCSAADPPSISKALFELSQDPAVGEFLNAETRARLRAGWEPPREKEHAGKG